MTTAMGCWISLPGFPTPSASGISDNGNERGHQAGAGPLHRALHDCVTKAHGFFGYQVRILTDEHDAVARRNAKKRNEADE